MKQQVNLYLAQYPPPKKVEVSRKVVAVSLGISVLVFAGLGYGIWKLETVKQKLEIEKSARELAQQSVDRLKNAVAQSAEDDKIKVQLIELKEKVKEKQLLLEQLEKQGQLSPAGFANNFIALGKQDVRGLWLSRVEIDEYGQKVALYGETTNPALVPEYLQRLSREGTFKGVSFKVFKLDKDDEELTTRPGVTIGFVISTYELPTGLQMALQELREARQ